MEGNPDPLEGIQQRHKHGIHTAMSSTPYFLPRSQNNLTEELSEESINFYATSK